MNTKSLTYNLAATLLKILLLAALIGAGWNVYRKLPGGGTESADAASETMNRLDMTDPFPRLVNNGA